MALLHSGTGIPVCLLSAPLEVGALLGRLLLAARGVGQPLLGQGNFTIEATDLDLDLAEPAGDLGALGFDLRAPVLRVTGYDVPYPYWQLEDAYVPSEARVVDAVRRVLAA